MSAITTSRFGVCPGNDKRQTRPLQAGDIISFIKGPSLTHVSFFTGQNHLSMGLNGPDPELNSGALRFNGSAAADVMQLISVATGLGFESLGADKFRLIE